MDKADFIKSAPAYYELAVVLSVWEAQRLLSEDSIRSDYKVTEDDRDPEPESLLGSTRLLQNALAALASKNVVAVIEDTFGPTLYERAEGINQYIEDQLADKSTPFYKANRAPNRTAWVINALARMNRIYNELAITEADLVARDIEWEPIPLDRSSQSLTEVIETVNETINQVEQSNGYSANHPEERNYVVDNLKLIVERLKTGATISYGYLRTHGLRVLQRIADKFSGAAMGEAAKEALKALGRWLHEVLPSLF